MKSKMILPGLALLLVSVTGFSQVHVPFFTLGAKAGVNVSKIDGVPFSKEFQYGYHLGGFATLKIGSKWQLQPEVLFNQYNTKTDSSFGHIFDSHNVQNVTLNYLSIPLLLNYSPSPLITFQAGTQFGIMLDKNKSLVQNGQSAFKSGDLSLLGGIQLNLMNFRVGARYFVGLNDISNITNSNNWKNQGFQLSLGIRII
jgi:hypothetical protein